MSPALNPEKLLASVTDIEFVPARRGRQAEDNPFYDVVLDSYNNEQGKAVRVPHSGELNKTGIDTNVAKVVNQIRAAAKFHEVGVSVQTAEHSKTQTDVMFLAKDRRSYTKNGDDSATEVA